MRPDSTAIVTGGARGIGQSICVELARRGARVVVADLDSEEMAETAELVEETGQRCEVLETNVASSESVQETVEWVLEEFGSIECLVNNAGIAGPTAPCEGVSTEEWEQTLAVNLKGPFQMCREVIPHMRAASFGRIVNIASVTGKRPLPNRTPYATSKMGVIGFTRTLAAEVGDANINVNAVCPGSVDGPRIRRVFERQAEETGQTYEEVRGEVEREAARGELVDREDVADLVGYLCSEQAERITGQDINVSAGKVMY
ncbi:SDR family NAD(P)-dependent oxidoreductase [Haloarcula onubensis]|uniref:SDR family oxidoreductase n=1 Tax=Haloarcula onubensis TaxID=2950539 RepID=A0ABU2FNQ8_9EURY|nr:SDR family NAD(P)-dependent oxidoreductase [Halomicroarcula sp. S3CR25-11]MDS0281927.1 SDR family oxidoreductase [Halomicroarcula sp. S3CR25-11]